MERAKNGHSDPKENLVVIEVLAGSMIVPPNRIKRYLTINQRVFRQFHRDLTFRKELKKRCKGVDCSDCD